MCNLIMNMSEALRRFTCIVIEGSIAIMAWNLPLLSLERVAAREKEGGCERVDFA